ncbi:Hypothetical predicted protein [Mytilus galloprovincialis]|uniref:Uncharacterized protein n=1 Tax=Mytilus galloprovincialis TaxID=29158 RepID=A0A8B6EY85_MYTGA|nr:Hypothetical predicted protein [Mytilus galloprovincialis]
MAESVARYPNMRRFSANPPSMSVKLKTEPSTSMMSDNYYMMPSNPHDSEDRQYFIMREQQLLSELRNKDDIKNYYDDFQPMHLNPHNFEDEQYNIIWEQRLVGKLRNKVDFKRNPGIGGANPQPKPIDR